MRRLNLSTALTIAGDATTGNIAYSGLSSPTITEVGDNPDVSVASDGVFTVAALGVASEVVTVKVQDAAGYFIQGPVTITGDGTGVEYMKLGMNLASASTYSGAYHFANMCHSMGPWARRATSGGSGAFTQSFGTLTATVATDQFRAYLSDAGYGWPDGVYTVRNPDGCEIAFGSNNDAPGTYTTSTSFTIDLSPSGGNGVYLFVKGSLTRLEIIQPGHVTSYDSGNIWSADFLAFHQALGCDPIRSMDLVVASSSQETNWADRVPANALSFVSGGAGGSRVVPWEYIIDLSNRLDVDAWICVPVRATTDYLSNLAALFAANLNSHLRVYPERGNEVWNFGSAWAECAQWVTYFGNTKYTATANYGANTFTYAGHGMTTGDSVRCFDTPENRTNALNQNYPYPGTASGLTAASVAYVEVVDANTFKLYSNVGRTTLLTVAAKQLNQIYIRNPSSSAANPGNMLIQNWDAFDAALGVDRVVHVVASQSANAGITASRFTNTAMAARADCVAVAPYFNGHFFAGRIVTASGQFTPYVWSAYSDVIFHFAVYAAGSTPTIDEVMSGTGAGFVSHQQGTRYTLPDPAIWLSIAAGFAPVTGLTNGTSYEVFLVLSGTYMITETVTASASATTTIVLDTFAEQAKRMIANAYFTGPPEGHWTASGGLPVICYEAAPDFNADQPSTDYADIEAWRVALQESAEYAEANRVGLHIRASQNLPTLTFFADTGSGSFSIANTYSDTSDLRYVGMAALAGRVPIVTPPVVADATASRVSADPGSFPHDVFTFADPSLTYTLLSNKSGNFGIAGDKLQLIDDRNVTWASSMTYNLSIMASNGYTIDLFTVTITLGAAVFEAETDALLARMSPPPDATHASQINDVFVALKASSTLAKLDGFYINTDPQASQITENWVSSSFDQANEGGTFTANSGVAGNGTSAYLNTAFNPATATSPNFQRNSAHLWAFSLTTAASAAGYEVGSDGASGWALSTGRSDQANAPRGGLNDSWANYPAQADCKGMYVISRTSSNLTTMYKDGASIGTSAAASTSAPSSYDMAALRYNAIYSDKKLAGWGFGGGLTSADVSAMSAAVTAYLTARGAI